MTVVLDFFGCVPALCLLFSALFTLYAAFFCFFSVCYFVCLMHLCEINYIGPYINVQSPAVVCGNAVAMREVLSCTSPTTSTRFVDFSRKTGDAFRQCNLLRFIT